MIWVDVKWGSGKGEANRRKLWLKEIAETILVQCMIENLQFTLPKEFQLIPCCSWEQLVPVAPGHQHVRLPTAGMHRV